MTEQQIEAQAEWKMDRVDGLYLEGKLTDAEYDEEMRWISRWARQQARPMPQLPWSLARCPKRYL